MIINFPMKNKGSVSLLFLLAFGLLCFSPSPALAYIGPGLGIALIWTLLGPVAALVTLALIVGYYPARYFYKKYKKSKEGDKEDLAQENSGKENSPSEE